MSKLSAGDTVYLNGGAYEISYGIVTKKWPVDSIKTVERGAFGIEHYTLKRTGGVWGDHMLLSEAEYLRMVQKGDK